jgi:hypothetical protein
MPAGRPRPGGALPGIQKGLGQRRTVVAGEPQPQQVTALLWLGEILVGGA